MRLNFVFVLVGVASSCVWTCLGQLKSNTYQFEKLESTGAGGVSNTPWVWRSNAEGLKTLRLDQPSHKTVLVSLCAEPQYAGYPVTAYINNILYSNDGASDTVRISINNTPLTTFKTKPIWNWGHQWNVFESSGQIGPEFELNQGTHVMRLEATTDIYGVELDKVDVRTFNQNPTVNIVCGSTFIQN